MTTTPHILAGAALASLLPTNSTSMRLIGFVLGFAAHYILDAVPHWERLYGPHYNDELPGSYSSWPRHIISQGLADALIGCAAFFTILVFAVPGPGKTIVFWAGRAQYFLTLWTASRGGPKPPNGYQSGAT